MTITTATPAALSQAAPIVVYSSPGCRKCDWTKRALASAGLPFVERSVLEPEAEAAARATGFTQLPIVVDRDETWCDFRPDLIEQAAARATAEGRAS